MIADLQRQLGVDASFFAQLLIFLCIFIWLQLVYFKPYLELIQRRQKRSAGLSGEAAALEEEAARAEQEYKDALQVARKRAAAERDRILGEARKGASEIVAASRAEAKSALERAREAAANSSSAEMGNLRGQVASVAGLLVEKLTKTKVGL